MKSMTGMGRAHGVVLGSNIRLEIRSINHRFCEVSVRLPGRYMPIEILIQQTVKKVLSRGKIDIFVNEEKSSGVSAVEIDAYRNCYEYFFRVRESLGLGGEITLQDLISGVGPWIQREIDVEKVWADFEPILQAALQDLMRMREKEGQNLKKDLSALLNHLEDITGKIATQKGALQADLEKRLKEKLAARIEELGQIDPLRLQMEVVYYLDRADITEELQRLNSHFDQARIFLGEEAPAGRKIDFLIQEFNREYNTIASKSQNSLISHFIVEAKAELEKFREQVQNIE